MCDRDQPTDTVSPSVRALQSECLPGGCQGLNIIHAEDVASDVIIGTAEADCIIATDKHHIIYGLGGVRGMARERVESRARTFERCTLCLFACLLVCLLACLPACLPACLQDDIIYGSAEADEIWGGTGTDVIFGVSGKRTRIKQTSAHCTSCIKLSSSPMPSEQGGGDDLIYGGPGNNVIFGEQG